MVNEGRDINELVAALLTELLAKSAVAPESLPTLIVAMRRAFSTHIEQLDPSNDLNLGKRGLIDDVPPASKIVQPDGSKVHLSSSKALRSESVLLRDLVPAVPIKLSVHDDYIVSLEDGVKFRSLRRHLMARYNMTPDDYRKKWGLPADYPMVAPSYARERSAVAKRVGLGRRLSDAKRRGGKT